MFTLSHSFIGQCNLFAFFLLLGSTLTLSNFLNGHSLFLLTVTRSFRVCTPATVTSALIFSESVYPNTLHFLSVRLIVISYVAIQSWCHSRCFTTTCNSAFLFFSFSSLAVTVFLHPLFLFLLF